MFSLVCLKQHRRRPRARKGAMLVLVAVSLVLLLVAAAFSVDVAYMHLVREELHIATDAAAKAAVTGLSQGGTSTAAIEPGHRLRRQEHGRRRSFADRRQQRADRRRSPTCPAGVGHSPRMPRRSTAASVTVEHGQRHDARRGEPVLRPVAGDLHLQPHA